jgi:CHAD domain-containing protein
MRTNGSATGNAQANTVDQQSRVIFNRMGRYIDRLRKDTKAADVHRFRTNSRRVEALLAELAPETGNKKKLLKLLSKLRKKAGKVRDLDVEIAFLKDLKIPDRQNHRTQLLQALVDDHARRTKKLLKYFGGERLKELRKRLGKSQSEFAVDGIDPLKLAFKHLPAPGQVAPTEKMLHACRIAAKRARYLAELLPESQDAVRFVAELKRAQDEIGRWHDVLKLTQRAEKSYGSARESALVAALQNITHARFRRAGAALQNALVAVAELRRRTSPQPPVPKPAEAAVSQGAAA